MAKEPISKEAFLMLIRQMFFLGVSAVEQYLAVSPTTKQKLDWWKQQNCTMTYTDYPEYESNEA